MRPFHYGLTRCGATALLGAAFVALGIDAASQPDTGVAPNQRQVIDGSLFGDPAGPLVVAASLGGVQVLGGMALARRKGDTSSKNLSKQQKVQGCRNTTLLSAGATVASVATDVPSTLLSTDSTTLGIGFFLATGLQAGYTLYRHNQAKPPSHSPAL